MEIAPTLVPETPEDAPQEPEPVRDSRGRFLPGNNGGRDIPRRKRPPGIVSAIRQTGSTRQWLRVLEGFFERARDGSVEHARFLKELWIGKACWTDLVKAVEPKKKAGPSDDELLTELVEESSK
jgi:hypothetical protein